MIIHLGNLRKIISEALKTSDANYFANAIVMAAGKLGAKVSAEASFTGKILNVFARLVMGNPDDIEPTLIDVANTYGWVLLSRSDRRGTVWWFEPSPQLKGHVKDDKIPQILWHNTPANNVDNILSMGLEPRSRSVLGGTSRRYSPRVYLATDRKGAIGTVNNDTRWVMLKIDRSKLPKGQKFYVDQEFGHRLDGTPTAIYTMDPIPPTAISQSE